MPETKNNQRFRDMNKKFFNKLRNFTMESSNSIDQQTPVNSNDSFPELPHLSLYRRLPCRGNDIHNLENLNISYTPNTYMPKG